MVSLDRELVVASDFVMEDGSDRQWAVAWAKSWAKKWELLLVPMWEAENLQDKCKTRSC